MPKSSSATPGGVSGLAMKDPGRDCRAKDQEITGKGVQFEGLVNNSTPSRSSNNPRKVLLRDHETKLVDLMFLLREQL